MSFRVGQRVRYVGKRSAFHGAIGTVVRKLDYGRMPAWLIETDDALDPSTRSMVDGLWWVDEAALIPISDYDGNTVTTWAQSVWKPNRVRA
jgi:hypothetical protein